MKKILFSLLFSAVMLSPLCAEEASHPSEPETVAKLLSGMDHYRDQEITMKLRLKQVDRIFFTVSFYDSENHDIVFDVPSKDAWKNLSGCLLNAHTGMLYSVKMMVKGSGNLGLPDAELLSFEPVILDLMP